MIASSPITLLLLVSLLLLLLTWTAAAAPLTTSTTSFSTLNTPSTASSLLQRRYSLQHRHDDAALLSNLQAPTPQYFPNRVDHFNPIDLRTYPQRFYANASLFTGAGPIFLNLGGEGADSGSAIAGHGLINTWAASHAALMLSLEHRFYGESIPLNDTAISNLRYLTIEQALADVAAFIDHVHVTYHTSPHANPTIVVGGSYSGALAAWSRLKYPHLFAGAHAVSAPVQSQVDLQGYLEIVGRALGEECAGFIAKGEGKIAGMLTSSEGRAGLKKDFNLCGDGVVDALDAAMFVELFAVQVEGLVQYGNPASIAAYCAQLQSLSPDPYQAIVLSISSGSAPQQCLDVDYGSLIAANRQPSAYRSWFWTQCTAWGNFQTAGSTRQPFATAFNVTYFLAQCRDVFGIDASAVSAGVQALLDTYGGREIDTSYTMFTSAHRGTTTAQPLASSAPRCTARSHGHQRASPTLAALTGLRPPLRCLCAALCCLLAMVALTPGVPRVCWWVLRVSTTSCTW